MNARIYDIVSNISIFACLIPLLFVWYVIKSNTKYLFPIVILVIISVITEALNTALLISQSNNLFVFRIFTALELLLIAHFYKLFFKSKKINSFIYLAYSTYIIITYIDYRVNTISGFDNYSTAFESIFFSIMSLLWFFFIIQKRPYNNLVSEPVFWINTSILMYFGGNLTLFVFNNYLLNNESSGHMAMWTIHSCLNILYNCLIAIAFWKTRRP